MTFLTTKSVLDAAQSMIVDQTAAMRLRMLNWLNLSMQSLVNEPREWEFLKKTASLPITANVITLPADYSDFGSLTVGAYFFTSEDQLTASETFQSSATGGAVPSGFVIDEKTGTLTIIPATTEVSVVLGYKGALPAGGYTDSTTATIFPEEFKPYLVRCLMTLRNEFDEEGQFPLSLQINVAALRAMKALDNKRKAVPKISTNGYIRNR
jgi:hypothetical protein